MKKLALLALLVSLAFCEGYKDFAQAMGYETKYETAIERAKKENKNLMVLMVTDYCPWCSKFEKKTLSDKAVDSVIKSKYIPLILNKSKSDFPKYLNAPMVPAVFFVKPNEQKIFYENIGFTDKAEFLNLLEQLE